MKSTDDFFESRTPKHPTMKQIEVQWAKTRKAAGTPASKKEMDKLSRLMNAFNDPLPRPRTK